MINAKEETILKCTDSLFVVSQELYEINPEISNTILLICDRLLKGVERAESASIQVDSSAKEKCSDCGGIKHDHTQHSQVAPQYNKSEKIQGEVRSLIEEIRAGL
jgi:hypothetical protein